MSTSRKARSVQTDEMPSGEAPRTVVLPSLDERLKYYRAHLEMVSLMHVLDYDDYVRPASSCITSPLATGHAFHLIRRRGRHG